MTLSAIFFKKLPPHLGRIFDYKTTFVRMGGGIHLFHPLVLSEKVFFVDCNPSYLQKYFFPGLFPLVKEVYLHTTIPNTDMFYRRFEFNPNFYVLPHESELTSHERVIITNTNKIINEILN